MSQVTLEVEEEVHPGVEVGGHTHVLRVPHDVDHLERGSKHKVIVIHTT